MINLNLFHKNEFNTKKIMCEARVLYILIFLNIRIRLCYMHTLIIIIIIMEKLLNK